MALSVSAIKFAVSLLLFFSQNSGAKSFYMVDFFKYSWRFCFGEQSKCKWT
jgi:hypothetical protein